LEIEKIAESMGIRLTKTELALLRKNLDRDGDGFVSRAELSYAGRKALQERSARELCLSVIEKPVTPIDRLGHYAVSVCDYGGTAVFAVVGTQIAGDAGMNIVGCALVGCVAAMGGGTLNNLLYGSSAPVHGRPGVFWARDHRYLAIALGASVLTFFAWPVYCRSISDHYLEGVIGKENVEEDGSVSKAAFVAACHRDEDFLASVRTALPSPRTDPGLLFHQIDTKNSGTIKIELKALVQRNFDNSFETFVLDTAALAGFAVAAVHGAIGIGLHPLVAMSSGVTICFGGILRDVLCNRDLAIGSQSYAVATGVGSTVYVLLRELSLRGIHIPLIGRIFLSAGSTVALRVWEYVRGEPLLAPMFGRNQAPHLLQHPLYEKQKDVEPSPTYNL
jgi:uncharacterized membrane protein YeiH